jgi:hypothetical protein
MVYHTTISSQEDTTVLSSNKQTTNKPKKKDTKLKMTIIKMKVDMEKLKAAAKLRGYPLTLIEEIEIKNSKMNPEFRLKALQIHNNEKKASLGV